MSVEREPTDRDDDPRTQLHGDDTVVVESNKWNLLLRVYGDEPGSEAGGADAFLFLGRYGNIFFNGGAGTDVRDVSDVVGTLRFTDEDPLGWTDGNVDRR